jgi:hypothetical protein
MVDAEDVPLVIVLVEQAIELACALEVGPEWFLDEQPPVSQGFRGVSGQAGFSEARGGYAEAVGGTGEVEEAVGGRRREVQPPEAIV